MLESKHCGKGPGVEWQLELGSGGPTQSWGHQAQTASPAGQGGGLSCSTLSWGTFECHNVRKALKC